MPTRDETRSILRRLGVRPSRRLGQSFLVDSSKARAMVESVEGDGLDGASLLEIGPGLGSLTGHLLERPIRHLTAVEICSEFAGYLSDRFEEEAERLTVLHGDFLRASPAELPGYPFDIVVGNLPYSISSPAIVRLLQPDYFEAKLLLLMLQKEVAVRASCLSGGKEYGRLALAIWPYFSIDGRVLDLPARSFYPTPAVSSRVVALRRRDSPLVSRDLSRSFERLVRLSFSSRRKTLLNNLARAMPRERASALLEKVGVDSRARAEDVRPEVLLALARELR